MSDSGDLGSNFIELVKLIMGYVSLGNKFLFVDKPNKIITGIVGTLLIILAIFGVFSYEAATMGDKVKSEQELQQILAAGGSITLDDKDLFADWTQAKGNAQKNGQAQENQETSDTVNIPVDYVSSVTVTLTWTDEPDGTIFLIKRLENQPDEFMLKLTSPTGVTVKSPDFVANARGQSQTITLNMEVSHDSYDSTNGTGDWTVTVICGECGDQNPRVGLLGRTDDGNDYEFGVEWTYWVEE